ncbi:MAG: hypothetical protein HeimC2_25190 [Candidatus Heimdallarchaeota archaeon LC_2]|nr:MAG: hypothetical protein HeimC2_25190 [Candidatus Heimdallarchaeota archaeon LC_2]
MDTYLELIDICKSYYTDDGVVIKANDHVNFILKKGEVHALLAIAILTNRVFILK